MSHSFSSKRFSADRIAIFLSLLGVIFSAIVADRVYEHLAHLEDEITFVWQAQALTRNHLTLPSPSEPKSFLVPFVVDYNGQRFGKYPPGWPLVLSLGMRLGLRWLVNPLLGGLAVWLTYLLGKRVFGEKVGLIAAGLTVFSPFFLVNSGSLLSHPLGLALSAGFSLAWLQAFGNPSSSRPWLPTTVAAICLASLVLTRPFTAVAVAFPFALHGLYLMIRGNWQTRGRLLAFGGIVLLLGSLYFVWQYAVTGDPLLNPYTLWWPYDRIGFGPGHGHKVSGHTLDQAWINTKASLTAGWFDLFGWPKISWIFLPFGLLAALRSHARRVEALLLSSVFFSLVVFYLSYWIGSSLYGPRYFYEGLYSLTLLSAAGIALLAGWSITTQRNEPQSLPDQPSHRRDWNRLRPLAVTTLVALMVGFNLVFYLPQRMQMMHGLYGISRERLKPFLSRSAQQYTPALVIVHILGKWTEYGALLELENPFLDSPFIFAMSRGPETNRLLELQFPDRAVYHYYADQPYKFYSAAR